MKKLLHCADKKDDSDLKELYRELAYFITTEKKWLETGEKVDAVHKLFQVIALRRDLRLALQKNELYSKVLTHELEVGKDIILDDNSKPSGSCSRNGRSDDKTSGLDQMPLAHVVADKLAGCHSAVLHRTLYGELPGVSYRTTPPGRLDPVRLVRKKPAFQCSLPVPTLKSAMVVSPVAGYGEAITIRLQKEAARPGSSDEKSGWFLEKRSDLLASFMTPHIRNAFLAYLYRVGGGETGNLRVLFPAARNNDGGGRKQKPYKPACPGWIKPGSVEAFKKLASVWKGEFVNTNDRLLREVWVSRGFNQSDLCLLDSEVVNACLESWLDSIDWPVLIPQLNSMPEFCSYVQEKESGLLEVAKEHLKEIEEEESEGQELSEFNIEGKEAAKKTGIINDIIY